MKTSSERHRIAYAFYMGGLTYAEVGRQLGITGSRARELVKIVDRRIEWAARDRERELHGETPRQWFERVALPASEDLPGVIWFEHSSVPRYERP